MKNKNKKYASGFSIVELIVIMAIIGIMSSVVIVNMRSTDNISRTMAAQREVTSAIRLVQNYALQGKTQPNGAAIQAPCGYGIVVLDATHYRLFYNFFQSGGGRTDCGSQNNNSNYRTYNVGSFGKSAVLSDNTLPTRVSFDPTSLNKSIFFTLPSGGMFDGATGSNFAGMSIGLGVSGDATSAKTVVVGIGGTVSEL